MRLRLLQVLTFAAFGLCAFLAFRLLDRPVEIKQPTLPKDSVGVATAIQVGQEREIAVTGYLHEGGGWPTRLCNGRDRADTPRCIGPFLYVERLDLNQFNLEKGTVEKRPVQWVDEPVTLLGRIRGTEITVSQVLGTAE